MKAWYEFKPEWAAAVKENEIELRKDWCFFVEIDGVVREFWVPMGYICDGASIPKLAWLFPGIGTPTSGFNAVGAWAHDPLYLTHALTRAQADEVAFRLWLQAGKPEWAAKLMWAAIRSPAGAWAYRNTAKDAEELAKVRRMLRFRENYDKFKSLWFVEQPMPLAA